MACFQSATLQSPEESDGCPTRETDWSAILTHFFPQLSFIRTLARPPQPSVK